MLRVYLARGMTGRIKAEVVEEAARDRRWCQYMRTIPLCPVEIEEVQPTLAKLLADKKHMDIFWARDKQMIRNAHVIFDMTPHLNSEGCKHELGYARYCLWKPVIRVFPTGQKPFTSSVAFYEDDYITDSIVDALWYANEYFGTRKKRVLWRLKMLRGSFLKWVKQQIREFFI